MPSVSEFAAAAAGADLQGVGAANAQGHAVLVQGNLNRSGGIGNRDVPVSGGVVALVLGVHNGQADTAGTAGGGVDRGLRVIVGLNFNAAVAVPGIGILAGTAGDARPNSCRLANVHIQAGLSNSLNADRFDRALDGDGDPVMAKNHTALFGKHLDRGAARLHRGHPGAGAVAGDSGNRFILTIPPKSHIGWVAGENGEFNIYGLIADLQFQRDRGNDQPEVFAFLIGAGRDTEREHHAQRQDKCKELLHVCSHRSFLLFLSFCRIASVGGWQSADSPCCFPFDPPYGTALVSPALLPSPTMKLWVIIPKYCTACNTF